ncbi:MAG: AAA family ATPase [Candidatus Altiarchaeota archaeon]
MIAVSNQKGGVGKTITAMNLSAALALKGKKTLLVDSDPQANTTSGIGFDKHGIRYSIYDGIIRDRPLDDILLPTNIKNLHLVPSNVDLAGAEIEMVPLEYRETRLRHLLYGIREKYDYIIIDCPPSLGLLTLNGLTASDSVLIPVQCDYYAMEGMSQLLYTIDLVKNRLNPGLKLEGILLTMYDPKIKLSVQVADEVKHHFKDRVHTTIIPRNAKLGEAPSFGKTILEYDKNSPGAKAYMELAKEVIENG